MLKSISIAAPAYNEGESLCSIVEKWILYLQDRFKQEDYEIVVCDDGSKDNTWHVLCELARRYPSVKPCQYRENQGAGAALAHAIKNTTKDWIFLLDSDGQYPIDNLAFFLKAHDQNPALSFIGFRLHKNDSAFARFGSWASGQCCNLFHGTSYRDFNCALKLVEGPLLRGLNLEAKGLNYSTEISSKILESGVIMKEVEALHQPRRKGRSSRTLIRGSLHRLFWVIYIGFRQFLFKQKILQRRPYF
jgi:dolichol-phosphate mannosyltransferase